MTTPSRPPLSPAAQAVLDAANGCCSYGPDDVLNECRWIVAAALRAAADQGENLYDQHEGKVSVIRTDKLLAIAAELEAQP